MIAILSLKIAVLCHCRCVCSVCTALRLTPLKIAVLCLCRCVNSVCTALRLTPSIFGLDLILETRSRLNLGAATTELSRLAGQLWDAPAPPPWHYGTFPTGPWVPGIPIQVLGLVQQALNQLSHRPSHPSLYLIDMLL